MIAVRGQHLQKARESLRQTRSWATLHRDGVIDHKENIHRREWACPASKVWARAQRQTRAPQRRCRNAALNERDRSNGGRPGTHTLISLARRVEAHSWERLNGAVARTPDNSAEGHPDRPGRCCGQALLGFIHRWSIWVDTASLKSLAQLGASDVAETFRGYELTGGGLIKPVLVKKTAPGAGGARGGRLRAGGGGAHRPAA